jgi:hypothetical protein
LIFHHLPAICHLGKERLLSMILHFYDCDWPPVIPHKRTHRGSPIKCLNYVEVIRRE